MPKLKPQKTVKLKTYSILHDAVALGVEFGYNRAFKHTDKPEPEIVKERIVNEVMMALSGVMDLSGE